MRFHELKVKVADKASDRYGQIGYIESYKWYETDMLFLVRFNNKFEMFKYNQVEITKESIEEWEKYNGEKYND